MSSIDNVKGKATDRQTDSNPVMRTVTEPDVSLDEMLSLACRQGKLDIVKLLVQSGAKVNHKNKGGNTPLLEACSQGHVGVAKFLLDNGADIDAPTETTLDSALTWACTLGNISVVDLLLDRSANVEHRTKDGCTALMFACLAGHAQVSEKLLNSNAEINVESDSNKDSPLTFACWKGHSQVVDLLLQRGADIEHRTKEGFSPLMFAALGGHTEVAAKLLARGAHVNTPSGSNNDIPLTSACWKGHQDVVKLLLEHCSNIEHRTKDGCTPLMLAAREGHFSVAKLLLENKAHVNVPSGSENNIPLTLACWKGHTEVVELLLDYQSDIEHRNKAGCTPLMLAAREGHLETTGLLLQMSAQVNVPSGSNDDTPLTLACWKGHDKVVELLLQSKSNVDHQTKTGCTPLMEATREGHKKVAEILLNHGADVELPDNYGQSPLFMACWKGHKNVAELLLHRGANRDCRTKTGITPLFQACRENHVSIVELLFEYGASVNSPFPNSRENPLTLAAEKGHMELVNSLLKRGANNDCHTKKGCTPLFLSCKEGHKEIAEQLRIHGADMEASDSRGNTPIMAGFKNGHVHVVEWLLKHIYHLPSDEICHKILMSVVDEKDKEILVQKRSICLALIQEAKKSREVQALRNAEILVQELDDEKNREEIKKKKQAARRRDKRKKKKSLRDSESGSVSSAIESEKPHENRVDEGSISINSDRTSDIDEDDGEDSYPEVREQGHDNECFDDVEEEEPKIVHLPHENREPITSRTDSVLRTDNEVCLKSCGKTTAGNVTVGNGAGRRSDIDVSGREAKSKQESQHRRTSSKEEHVAKDKNAKGKSDSGSDHVSLTEYLAKEQDTSLRQHDNHDHGHKSNKGSSYHKRTDKHSSSSSSNRSSESSKSKDGKSQESKSSKPNDNIEQRQGLPSPSFIPTFEDEEDLEIDDNMENASLSSSDGILRSSSGQEKEKGSGANLVRSLSCGAQSCGDYSEESWKELFRTNKTMIIHLSVSNAHCGRVIGRGGSKINSITEESRAQITVNKPEPTSPNDRVITIKGHPHCVEKARALVTEALNSPSVFQGPRNNITLGGFIDQKVLPTTTVVSATSTVSKPKVIQVLNRQTNPVDSLKSIGVSTSAESTFSFAACSTHASLTDVASTTSSSALRVSYSKVTSGVWQQPGVAPKEGSDLEPKLIHTTVAMSTSSDTTTVSRAFHPAAPERTSESDELSSITTFGAIGESRGHIRSAGHVLDAVPERTIEPQHASAPQSPVVTPVRVASGRGVVGSRSNGSSPVSAGGKPSQSEFPRQLSSDESSAFSYFSPWPSRGNDSSVEPVPLSSTTDSTHEKRQQVPLQSFTSLLNSDDIPPFPWQSTDPNPQERSRSTSWSAITSQSSSDAGVLSGADVSILPDGRQILSDERSISTDALNSGSRQLTNLQPWSNVLGDERKASTDEPNDESVFIDKSPWVGQRSERLSDPSSMNGSGNWDPSTSPNSSSLSSSRQELNNILDSDSGVGGSNLWVQTPTSEQDRSQAGQEGEVPYLETTMEGNPWIQNRGAYSAPSSPALQRTVDNPFLSPSGQQIRGHPSMEELTSRPYYKAKVTQRERNSSWKSRRETPPSITGRRMSAGALKDQNIEGTQDSGLSSPRYSRSGENVPVTIFNTEFSVEPTVAQSGWRHDRFNSVQSVTDLLAALSLDRYKDNFEGQGITLNTLVKMTEIDLQNLGLAKGPRLKLLKASEMLKAEVMAHKEMTQNLQFPPEFRQDNGLLMDQAFNATPTSTPSLNGFIHPSNHLHPLPAPPHLQHPPPLPPGHDPHPPFQIGYEVLPQARLNFIGPRSRLGRVIDGQVAPPPANIFQPSLEYINPLAGNITPPILQGNVGQPNPVRLVFRENPPMYYYQQQ